MQVKVTFFGNKGTVYSYIEDVTHLLNDGVGVAIGEFNTPFTPDNPAIGWVECLLQSDNNPFINENIVKVKVEPTENNTKYILVYDEYGENNLETWYVYKTDKYIDLPDFLTVEQLENDFEQLYYAHSEIYGKFDKEYGRRNNDNVYRMTYHAVNGGEE